MRFKLGHLPGWLLELVWILGIEFKIEIEIEIGIQMAG